MPIIDGKDTIVVGPQYSGMTTAAIIGMLNLIDPNSDQVQAIILSPSTNCVHKTTDRINEVG